MWRGKRFICLAAALVVAGCASYGADFDLSKFASFKEGVATKAEMIASVGPPASQSSLGNGHSASTWQYVTKTIGSNAKAKMATALFDSNDRLLKLTTSESSY